MPSPVLDFALSEVGSDLASTCSTRLRNRIERETEGVTPVSTRHKPLPIAPLHSHVRISRVSVNASVAATKQAMTLAQNGMKTPFTVTSHPRATRSN